MATGQANSKSFSLCADLHRSTQANDHCATAHHRFQVFPICPELTLRVVSFPVKPKKLPVNSRKGIEMGPLAASPGTLYKSTTSLSQTQPADRVAGGLRRFLV
jgi:hypothetical protein